MKLIIFALIIGFAAATSMRTGVADAVDAQNVSPLQQLPLKSKSIRLAAQPCNVARPAGTKNVSCTDPKTGQKSTKVAKGYSCYTATGQFCNGPNFPSDYVTCSPGGAVPAPICK